MGSFSRTINQLSKLKFFLWSQLHLSHSIQIEPCGISFGLSHILFYLHPLSYLRQQNWRWLTALKSRTKRKKKENVDKKIKFWIITRKRKDIIKIFIEKGLQTQMNESRMKAMIFPSQSICILLRIKTT